MALSRFRAIPRPAQQIRRSEPVDALPFDVYIALGDSMSIDKYPVRDLQNRGASNGNENVGAASLLYCNDSELYPEFDGNDLKRRCSSIEFLNFTEDGYTTEDVLEGDLDRLNQYRDKSERCLVTLSAGGNDLLQLHLYGKTEADRKAFFDRELTELQIRYDRLLSKCMQLLPNATMILTTVYDPTDGTGEFPGDVLTGEIPIEYIERFNDFVRATARPSSRLHAADVHHHFLGHGMKAKGVNDFWYWMPSPIEPGARGASEIRRVWLESIEGVSHGA